MGTRLFAALAVAAVALAGCARGGGAPEPRERATGAQPAAPGAPGSGAAPAGAAGVVTSITDGDTLRVRVGDREERVRIIGVDTPETRGPGGLRECFGKEATQHLARLLPDGTAVRLTRDVEERDRYGRLLAYVYRSSDGLFVNEAMARDGYADLLTVPPNVAHVDRFRAAVADARSNNRGLWAACGGADTPVA